MAPETAGLPALWSSLSERSPRHCSLRWVPSGQEDRHAISIAVGIQFVLGCSDWATYPKCKYHPTKTVIVKNAQEEAALGKGWRDRPFPT
jgi:hypothetical protein